MPLRFVLVFCLILIANFSFASEGKLPALWRLGGDRNICGSNSAYIFLSLSGVKVDISTIRDELPTIPEGNSLEDISLCIKRHGSNVITAAINYESLLNTQLPAIVHLEVEQGVTGHFAVVTSITPSEVRYIDGTTAGNKSLRKAEFCKYWTGYAVLNANPHYYKWSIALVVANLILLSLTLTHPKPRSQSMAPGSNLPLS